MLRQVAQDTVGLVSSNSLESPIAPPPPGEELPKGSTGTPRPRSWARCPSQVLSSNKAELHPGRPGGHCPSQSTGSKTLGQSSTPALARAEVSPPVNQGPICLPGMRHARDKDKALPTAGGQPHLGPKPRVASYTEP